MIQGLREGEKRNGRQYCSDPGTKYAFRLSMVGGRVVITHGVQGLTPQAKAKLLEQIRGFTAFTKANDPHSQHDFGSIDIGNQKFFWKIDAYDKSLQVGSPDPAEPAVTTRVMTIMRADEY